MNERILILGAGGHGLVVADILLRMQEAGPIQPCGFLDDGPNLAGTHLLGLPVLGPIAALTAIPHDAVVVAIGANADRRRLYERLRTQGERFVVACHPRAVVAPDVHLGAGSMLCAGAVVSPGSAIGANTILNTGCTVDHHNRIGDHVHVAPGAHLGGEVEVGDGVLLGIGAVVLPGCRIGAWAVVGACALVTRDVPAGAVVIGSPARLRSRGG